LENTYLENGQLVNEQLENRHLENEKYSKWSWPLRVVRCLVNSKIAFKYKYNGRISWAIMEVELVTK